MTDPLSQPKGSRGPTPLPYDASDVIATVEQAVEEIRAGRMVILVDDEDRENEGDLCMAAEMVTADAVNFMAKEGRGLICLPMTEHQLEKVRLSMMVPDAENSSGFGTAFTVSIEARDGVTTGISAHDRAHTILTAIAEDARPQDIVRPGHVFPLRARTGGVLRRAGQTEGAVDLARLAVVTVADLIEYRLRNEKLVRAAGEAVLPTREGGDFRSIVYENEIDRVDHIALVKGEIREDDDVLVRVHSECLTGDAFGSMRCDCGEPLEAAMKMIEEAGRGVILYMRQEGRGIGLKNKIKAYGLQDSEGHDTVQANEKLGFAADLRDYGVGAQILHDLGVRKMRIITNNPGKRAGIEGYGLIIVDRVPLEIEPNEKNFEYLRTKKEKLGHVLHLMS
jgi:3,4-dihydroxy 2-butanone 4-phosphate synthase/GTP cyclohydrolase II